MATIREARSNVSQGKRKRKSGDFVPQNRRGARTGFESERRSQYIPDKYSLEDTANRMVSRTADIVRHYEDVCFKRVKWLRSQLKVGLHASQREQGMAVL